MKLLKNNIEKPKKLSSSLTFIAYFFLFVFSISLHVDLSKKEKEGVLLVASQYSALITSYSNCKNQDKPDFLHKQIEDLFIGKSEFQSLPHACDLFKDEKRLSCADYLDAIEENYQHNLKVDFSSPPQLIKCSEYINNRRIVYVGFDKSLSFHDFPVKNVKIILAICISDTNFKIISVFYPKEYSNRGTCLFDQYNGSNKILFEQYFRTGDELFYDKDFINAIKEYESARLYDTNKHLESQIIECNMMLNLDSYKRSAELLFNHSEFYKAKDTYKQIIKLYPKEELDILPKINQCNFEIINQEYNRNKILADEYFAKQFYKRASQVYETCLEYKPNDLYSINKIKECHFDDPIAVKSIINQAIYLAEKEGKWAGAFKLLYNVEESQILTGDNYYFMAMMMDGRDQKVDKIMGFTKNMCNHLAIIYCKKAIGKGNKKAVLMWDDIFLRFDK
jgi:hypothetical protein